jgi:hypothetical protein
VRGAALRNSAIAAILFFSTAAMASDMRPDQRPTQQQIEKAVKQAGLKPENVVYFVDEEGVANADIYPVGANDAAYQKSVMKLMEWASRTGAAIGFSFAPKATQ